MVLYFLTCTIQSFDSVRHESLLIENITANWTECTYSLLDLRLPHKPRAEGIVVNGKASNCNTQLSYLEYHRALCSDHFFAQSTPTLRWHPNCALCRRYTIVYILDRANI